MFDHRSDINTPRASGCMSTVGLVPLLPAKQPIGFWTFCEDNKLENNSNDIKSKVFFNFNVLRDTP